MNTFCRVILLVGLSTALFMSVNCAQKPNAASETSKWRGEMDSFAAVTQDLFPMVLSQREFNNPDNFDKITARVDQMAGLSHLIEEDSKMSKVKSIGGDPSVRFIAKGFQREITRAQLALAEGKREFARSVLKRTASYCVRCHSRGNYGVEFARWQNDSRLKKLNDLERAELLTAVREYDAALKLYGKILSDQKLAKKKTFLWEKAAMQSLNLAVRVKQSPSQGLAIVGQISSTPRVAAFLKEDARAWKKSLLEWKSEKKNGKDGLVMARELIQKAVKRQGFFADKSSQIEYLRASTLLHDNLRKEKNKARIAESLYLLGQSYDALSDGAIAGISDLYYEACVDQAPHSKQAKQCYRRYEANLYFGFAGSGGMYMPHDIGERLQDLKKKAE